MTLKQAIKIAIECMRAQKQRLAVSASLFRLGGLESCRPAEERYERIKKAMGILRELEVEDDLQ